MRRNRGLILGPDGDKMSKSKGNVIDPDESVKLLGDDTVRLYLAFMGPYGDGGNYPWDPNGVVGVRRFLERIWKLATTFNFGQESHLQFKKELAKTIYKISDDFESFKFNTSISSMMILANWIDDFAKLGNENFISIADMKVFLKLLAPFAPHIAEELWHELGEKESIHLSKWPKADEKLLVDSEVKIMIQVNGKLKGELMIPVDTTEEEIKNPALSQALVLKALGGASPKKFIYVKGRLINIVF